MYFCSFPVRQEQELRNGGTVDKKLSTLADLFRPPIELMHKGSFETVRSHSPDILNTLLYSVCVNFLWNIRCALTVQITGGKPGLPCVQGQLYAECVFICIHDINEFTVIILDSIGIYASRSAHSIVKT